MKPSVRGWALPAFVLGVLSSEPALADRAGAFCASPRGGAPSMSFTLTTTSPGEMDRVCANEVRRAKELGFTTISLVPRVLFDAQVTPPRIVRGSGMNAGEIDRCLEVIWNAGLDVVYQPHVDNSALQNGASHREVWRGRYDIRPDATYENELFGEFTSWVGRHHRQILSGSRNVDVIVSAELETSNINRPQEWLDFSRRLRSRIYAQGVGTKVRLGLNPNWRPSGNPSSDECQNFRRFVASVDFIAPSFYGDWSQNLQAGSGQVTQRIRTVVSSLRNRGGTFNSCDVSEMASTPLAMGEFGVGGSLNGSLAHSTGGRIPDQVFEDRRTLFSNLLGWARQQQNRGTRPPLYLNLWALGMFDPVGVRTTRNQNTRVDTEIVRMIQEYTRWRCPGIQLPMLENASAEPAPRRAAGKTLGVCEMPPSGEPIDTKFIEKVLRDLNP